MAMDKQHILDEIRRIAKANGGKPPGEKRFEKESGITKYDRFPDHWVRWGDAQEEAGFARNKFQGAFEREFLIEKFIGLIRKNKQGNKLRSPVEGEVLVEKKNNPEFPHAPVFRERFGGKSQLAAAIVEYCEGWNGYEGVTEACEQPIKANPLPGAKEKESRTQEILGYVYLIKYGRHHKIGKTNAVGRRERELAIQLPEKAIPSTS